MTEYTSEPVTRHAMLHSFVDRGALNRALSQAIATTLSAAVNTHGRASIAFSGGSTPVPMLQALSQVSINWSAVHATLVDERWVATGHQDSNEAQLKRALLHGQAEKLAFTGLKTEHAKPELALETVSRRLDALPWPLDCAHLGMGADGHTASWFADAPEYARAINRTRTERVIALNPESAPYPRISLTANAVLNAKMLVLHITGKEKRRVLERAVQGDKSLPISVALRSVTPIHIYWAP